MKKQSPNDQNPHWYYTQGEGCTTLFEHYKNIGLPMTLEYLCWEQPLEIKFVHKEDSHFIGFTTKNIKKICDNTYSYFKKYAPISRHGEDTSFYIPEIELEETYNETHHKNSLILKELLELDKLNNANFQGNSFEGAVLNACGKRVVGTNFKNCNFSYTELSNFEFIDCNFSGASFVGASGSLTFKRCNVYLADFSMPKTILDGKLKLFTPNFIDCSDKK